MCKRENKLFYITLSTTWLLLLVIIGGLVYKSPENEAKKGPYTANAVVSPSSQTPSTRSSMDKHLRPALKAVQRHATFSLSVVWVGYCLYKSASKNMLLSISGFLVYLLYILPKLMHEAATISLTWRGMPASLQKLLRAIKGFTDFWLHPNLEVVCTAIVIMLMGIDCMYAYGSDCTALKCSMTIGVLCWLALVTYFIIEVFFYNFATDKELDGVPAYFVFSFVVACAVELLDPSKNHITRFSRMLYFFLCYLTVVVWIQSLLKVMGIKGYRKVRLPAWYSIASEDVYAIGLGFFNVVIQMCMFQYYWLLDVRFVALPILLLVVTLGTQLSIYLKLVHSPEHKATIVSCFMAVIYYAYISKFFIVVFYYGYFSNTFAFGDNSNSSVAEDDTFGWFFDIRFFITTFDWRTLALICLWVVLAIVVETIEHIALYMYRKTPFG